MSIYDEPVYKFDHTPPDGSAEVLAAIRKSRDGGLAIRLKAAASAVLAAPTTSDPALAAERDAGIDLLKAMKPASGLPGESAVQKLSREIAASIATEFATLKTDGDDETLTITKRALRIARTPDAAGGIEKLASGVREIVRVAIARELRKAGIA
jgi:hypothetical protein